MQADKALYIAHEKGHNRYVIYDVEKHGAVQPNRARDYSDLYAVPPVQSNAGFTADLVQEFLHGKPDMQSICSVSVHSSVSTASRFSRRRTGRRSTAGGIRLQAMPHY